MSDELRWAITDALASCLPRCGECSKWMKSRECPREKNVNGWTRGPSSGDVTCDSFVAKDAATAERIAERRKPLDDYMRRKVEQ